MRIGSRNIAHRLHALLLSLWILASEMADATVDPRTETVIEYCLPSDYSKGSGFEQNLRTFLQNLRENVSKKGRPYVVDSHQVNNRSNVYGLAECAADLNSVECRDCISVALNNSLNACKANGAVIRLRGCYLRYSPRPFFFSRAWDDGYQAVCNVQNNSDPDFPSAVQKILADATTAAKLAASGSGNKLSRLPSSMGLYAFARCNIWHGRTSGEACGKCLASAMKGLSSSCGERNLGARIWSENCFLRYEAYNFFSMCMASSLPDLLPFVFSTLVPSPFPSNYQIYSFLLNRIVFGTLSPLLLFVIFYVSDGHADILIMRADQSTGKRKRSKFLIIMVGIPVAAMILFGSMTLWVWKSLGRFQWKWLRRDLDEDWDLLASTVNPKLLFKYETLRSATGNFHFKNRLGIGGFGSVYKGIFPDGTEVAVKRLFVSPTQGGLGFMNEVNIISSVQHRNLVKLVGCSIRGPESFLVYEFLSNRSLDKILFDEQKSHILDWQRRFDIIIGTARGLAYLHEQSQIRIVHRDVKASNVLLDDNFNPKISDFGLARLLGDDQTHISTRIAGTFGYIDPEYALNGHLTEKSDIFSFGVLCLEIVSGRRNLDMPSLVGKSWRLHQLGNASSVIDAKVKGQIFREDEALRVIHVALLCTQTSPSLRPKMSEVILMLTNRNGEIRNLPQPCKPSFIGVVEVSVNE